MKKIFFLLLLVPFFGISQICYVSSSTKSASFVFSDDFSFVMDSLAGNYEENSFYFLEWNGTKSTNGEFDKSENGLAYFQNGIYFTAMVKEKCSESQKAIFKRKIEEYLKNKKL
ncbi:MAG: hypothetical protein ACK5IC_06890 [Moheibacter sp.]